ncbi:hypothetical protein PaeCFBP13512_22290 [Paenibacillus sp. CFBP13512]|uniref:hypothetical protein n=1 Tax=Paenibacillus sp. CFBP13512 TaxID=2184007 RepID=UPI0010BFAB34|nr:hypothetical protein [Paenibacillus sp. CFBP13512]TKJ83853.1 hypothetical protein PaeCFBP13512_22290 [Paenibacillus sp. CFBP13512]
MTEYNRSWEVALDTEEDDIIWTREEEIHSLMTEAFGHDHNIKYEVVSMNKINSFVRQVYEFYIDVDPNSRKVGQGTLEIFQENDYLKYILTLEVYESVK